jgi:hypothetical protein
MNQIKVWNLPIKWATEGWVSSRYLDRTLKKVQLDQQEKTMGALGRPQPTEKNRFSKDSKNNAPLLLESNILEEK